MSEKKPNDEDLKEVQRLLITTEVDEDKHKEKIYNQVKYKMQTETLHNNNQKKDVFFMKKKMKHIAIVTTVSVCLVGGFSTTTYGQEMIESIMDRFQIGDMEVTQYDQLPVNETNNDENASDTDREEVHKPSVSLEEARDTMETDFGVPTQMPDGSELSKIVMPPQDAFDVELQYTKEDELVSSLLISEGDKGISTDEEVKKEDIADKTVYFVNGIVLWEHEGLTYELYQMSEEGFGTDSLEKIIWSLASGEEYSEAEQFFTEQGVAAEEIDQAITHSIEKNNKLKAGLGEEAYEKLQSGEFNEEEETKIREEAAEILEKEGK
ncbi:hypothetical protein [Salibacterium aidingense]|uniref:hypothetical protein n=1 Tax=Salibacterium aidingense TaxID=384933 RepID=UPI0003FEF77B|nr:hypothetical protein [Salibacterium aidingense]